MLSIFNAIFTLKLYLNIIFGKLAMKRNSFVLVTSSVDFPKSSVIIICIRHYTPRIMYIVACHTNGWLTLGIHISKIHLTLYKILSLSLLDNLPESAIIIISIRRKARRSFCYPSSLPQSSGISSPSE